MNVNLSKATSAYQNNAKMMEGLQDGIGGIDDAAAQKASFADMMGDALNKAIDSQYASEQTKLGALTGKTELTDLVTAVSQAELTLNTVVTIRDRVISAYQDILRMPI